MTPLEAATHTDPYVYYSQLRHKGDLYYYHHSQVWVACRAKSVQAILQHPDCHVRPFHEPVPTAIAQSAAGEIFSRLMRMNDGPRHQCPRAVIEPILAAVAPQEIATLVARLIHQADGSARSLNSLMFQLPVSVLCTLMGFGADQLDIMTRLTRDFVACLSPLSNGAQLSRADVAANRLSEMFDALVSAKSEHSAFLSAVCRRYRPEITQEHDVLIANLIGLLSQTCEATAGLIGNTLTALVQRPELLGEVRLSPGLIPELIAEVARLDPAVQNTRRYAAKRCLVGDCMLEKGDTVLLLLASANRDPEANPEPDRLLLKRHRRQNFSFGYGKHQCPGQHIALAIASEALSVLLQQKDNPLLPTCHWCYAPSLNGRIPQFGPQPEIAQ